MRKEGLTDYWGDEEFLKVVSNAFLRDFFLIKEDLLHMCHNYLISLLYVDVFQIFCSDTINIPCTLVLHREI